MRRMGVYVSSSTSTSPRPGPELTPVKYWPSASRDHPDLGLFITRRDYFKRIAGIEVALAVPMVVLAVASNNPARPFVAGVAFFALAMGAAFWAIAKRMDVPPSGVWQVDEQGYPRTFVAPKASGQSRKDRGVTRAAFIESVASRHPH